MGQLESRKGEPSGFIEIFVSGVLKLIKEQSTHLHLRKRCVFSCSRSGSFLSFQQRSRGRSRTSRFSRTLYFELSQLCHHCRGGLLTLCVSSDSLAEEDRVLERDGRVEAALFPRDEEKTSALTARNSGPGLRLACSSLTLPMFSFDTFGIAADGGEGMSTCKIMYQPVERTCECISRTMSTQTRIILPFTGTAKYARGSYVSRRWTTGGRRSYACRAPGPFAFISEAP